MFVQFVALCYYEYLSEQLQQIRQTLASEITDPGNETADILKNKKKLLSRLKNTPVYLTLQWFDAVEEGTVSTKLLTKRWTTEITARDRPLLEKQGFLLSDVLNTDYTTFRFLRRTKVVVEPRRWVSIPYLGPHSFLPSLRMSRVKRGRRCQCPISGHIHFYDMKFDAVFYERELCQCPISGHIHFYIWLSQ